MESPVQDPALQWLLQANLLLASVFVLIWIFNGRVSSPLLGVVARWLRWAVVSVALGTLAYVLEWVERPLPVLIAVAAVVFLMAETVRNWMITGMMSRSELPLFPRYRGTQAGDEWPADSRVLRLRSWLRGRGFVFTQGFVAELSAEIAIRGSIYHDPARRLRVQVVFLPQPGGRWFPTLSLMSLLPDGTQVITDNSVVPFGGFFPDGYEVRRLPLMRSPEKLLARHQRRLKARGGESLAQPEDAIAALNAFQTELESVNLEMGVTLPRAQHEEHGRLSWEGRYRLWREIWMLEYLGTPGRGRL
jgi:hypothetical protein